MADPSVPPSWLMLFMDCPLNKIVSGVKLWIFSLRLDCSETHLKTCNLFHSFWLGTAIELTAYFTNFFVKLFERFLNWHWPHSYVRGGYSSNLGICKNSAVILTDSKLSDLIGIQNREQETLDPPIINRPTIPNSIYKYLKQFKSSFSGCN